MSALDPEVVILLDMIREADKPSLQSLSPEAARIAYATSRNLLQAQTQEVASVRDVTVPGAQDGLRLRIYRAASTQASDILPCLVYYHGGGWVVGDLDSHDRLCRILANRARICLIAVDYRLAPEHIFPAALDDAASALQWVSDNAAALSIAPGRIGVAGDSAGGNLAAVVALMGRDGSAPATIHQALLYPAVDLTASSPSYQREIAAGAPLSGATMHYFIDHYIPDAKERLDWHASPLKAASLAGTPPALVVTLGHDPLCDEGRAYAQRLENDGVRVTALHLSDQIHGMLMMGGVLQAANRTTDFIGDAIGAALHHGSPTSR
ncbi:MAG: acetyl esterase [Janthinobacterium sp.]|jgi:acetyl esterase